MFFFLLKMLTILKHIHMVRVYNLNLEAFPELAVAALLEAK